MRRHIVALTFVSLPLAVVLAASSADVTQTAKPASATSGIELDALGRRADPCSDFYQFACGGWITKNPLPADRRSYGRFEEVQAHNFTILRRILETPDATGDRKKASDYYAACMDESRIESSGLTPVEPDLKTIDELTNPDDLPVLVAHLQLRRLAFFRFGAQTDLDQATMNIAPSIRSGLGLPDRDYYLKTTSARRISAPSASPTSPRSSRSPASPKTRRPRTPRR